ncbi:MAG: His-Xaa-Ser repeat protein HxsA [Allorhizobium sp.]
MKRKLFLIPTLLAAGFFPGRSDAMPLPNSVSKKDPPVSLFERFRLHHIYTLAAHRSHSSHSSHSSHRSSSGGGYVYTPPARNSTSTPPSSVLPSTGSKIYQAVPNSAFPAAPSPAVPLKTLPGNTDKFRQIAMQVQTALTIYGYYTGAVDGLIGPESKVAISKMQQDYGLKVTGTITPEVLDAFKIIAN